MGWKAHREHTTQAGSSCHSEVLEPDAEDACFQSHDAHVGQALRGGEADGRSHSLFCRFYCSIFFGFN